jgi:hypothetical protein
MTLVIPTRAESTSRRLTAMILVRRAESDATTPLSCRLSELEIYLDATLTNLHILDCLSFPIIPAHQIRAAFRLTTITVLS